MVFFLFIFTQLSPGELHESHKHLEGVKNCSSCHEIGSKDFQKQCLVCHTFIAESIEKASGYHGRLQDLACQKCHKDHFGREFKLIHWKDGVEAFDHQATGYILKGGHKNVSCKNCHKKEHIQNPLQLIKARKKLEATFLGLSTDCSVCHQDVHQKRLGEQCSTCHQETKWRPAEKFNHQKTDFPLTGLHEKVACSGCHGDYKPESGPVLARRLDSSSCSFCHKDRHLSQLSNQCSQCHATDGWKPAKNFDHNRSRFALTGKHRDTSCDKCHEPLQTDRKYRNLSFESCGNCHKDAHQGRLGTNCSSCHDPSSWTQIRQNQFDHAATRFSLKGKHSQVRCDSCHKKNVGRKTGLQFDHCSRCHQDPHHTEFKTFESSRCEDCHNEEGFLPARFGYADHDKISFKLRGSHMAVACVECHAPRADKHMRFSFASKTCEGCHKNPHQPLTEVSFVIRCETCHQEDNWKDPKFDHDQTTFSLKGAHLKLKCSTCHKEQGKSWKLPSLRQKPSPRNEIGFQCQNCHKDPHGNQLGEECSRCHIEKSWKPEKFNHFSTRFPLDGAHIKVSCDQCHKKNADSKLVIYKPIDTACKACH